MEGKPAPIVVMRQPSTANLMLDSADRDIAREPLANNFQITRTAALLNGFFTRIGTTEIVLEWGTPNVSPSLGNNQIVIDLSGGTPGSGTITIPATIATGFYTQAQLVDALVQELDVAGLVLTPAVTWTAQAAGYFQGAIVTPSTGTWARFGGLLAVQLGLSATGNAAAEPWVLYSNQNPIEIRSVDLRPTRYIDFVSSQLTYNQELKDSSTASIVRDVLARWYFAYDQPPEVDQYGFPILMGYTAFALRRTFSPPKQIKWSSNQPLGNLSFQLYNDAQVLMPVDSSTNWLMTLQVSEV